MNTIKNIAFSLPFGYKLYVKEHPSAVGSKSNSFYKEIRKVPNVVLISPQESAESLIGKSQGVILLTSTMGLEAVLSGKLVYTLGDPFYVYHPMCRNINSFKELKKKIEEDLNNRPILSDFDNVRFVVAYLRNNIPGSIMQAVFKDDKNNYQSIYQNIKKMFC